MPENIIKNQQFRGLSSPRISRSISTFAPEWWFEHRANEPLEIYSEAGGGMTVRLDRDRSRVRIFQELDAAAVEPGSGLEATLYVTQDRNSTAGLTIDWIAILTQDEKNGRVFFAKPAGGSATISGEQFKTVKRKIKVPSELPDRPMWIAVQISGSTGGIAISSFECKKSNINQSQLRKNKLTSEAESVAALATVAIQNKTPNILPAAAEPAQIPALSYDHRNQSIIGLIFPTADVTEAWCFIDGKPSGRVQVTDSSESPAKALSLPVPTSFLDRNEHSVSVRAPDGRRLAFEAKLTFKSPAVQASPRLSRKSESKENNAKRRRVCVVSWDMGHNPVGRAYLLAEMTSRIADVELVGPLFPAYGTHIWPPIANTNMAVTAFPAGDFAEFIAGALSLAKSVKCDVVYVGKARFSSLLIGALIKHANGCPLVLDIDDHELSFFQNRTLATIDELAAAIQADPTILNKPYTEVFTRYAEGIISAADAITVSNYALQSRFGGTVVRHGRDERLFDPTLYDRKQTRAAFGYGDLDKVVLFLGTPRPHKGVFEIADALERLGHDSLALCVVGSINDKRVSTRFSAYERARIDFHPDQPWERLPELVNMADAVFLLQDPNSPIADYQIPAKLTDALALGVPVYATPVPPLRDLIAAGAIVAVESDDAIDEVLRNLVSNEHRPQMAQRLRDYYLTELSHSVNTSRIELAIEKATRNNYRMVDQFDQLFSLIEEYSGAELPRFKRKWHAPAVWNSSKPDLIFFWKQNDSDIYGRRSDMLAKYMIDAGRINRIIHFDAPMSIIELERHLADATGSIAHQGAYVYQNTVRRFLNEADTLSLHRRTFLYRTDKSATAFQGIQLPTRDRYQDFIRETLRQLDVSEKPIVWTSPVLFDYPAIKAAIDSGVIVADIIDDQRSFTAAESHRKRVDAAYEEMLGDADFVFANCEPVKEGFARFRTDICVVPNGAEEFSLKDSWTIPPELADLKRPILGYVGNLRDRVDLELIGALARAKPNASIVLIGSAHGRPEVLEIGQLPNVHLLGVKPYNESINFIKSFDVALVPHLRNNVSENMNPLKLYVYFALDVPIVTTDVANIGDIARFALVAHSHNEFIAAVEQVLAGKRKLPTAANRRYVLKSVSWKSRVNDIFRTMGL